MADGNLSEVDTIMRATWFEASFLGRFPVYGQGGVLLSKKWLQRPDSYFRMTIDQFPNCFIFPGPNSGLGTDNLIIMLQRMAEYGAYCVARIRTGNIRAMKPSRRAIVDFTNFCDTYLACTVYSEEYSSRYKVEGKDGREIVMWSG